MMKKRWASGVLAFAIAVSLLLSGVLPVASAGQDAAVSTAGEAVGTASDVDDGLESEVAHEAGGEESVREEDAPSIEELRSDASESSVSDEADAPVVRRKRELSSSGDLEYTLDFNWATVADKRNYNYDPADPKKLLITPDANGQRTVAWRVNLRVQHGEEAVLPAGSVKITVPSYLFETWRDEGDPTLVNVKVGDRLYEELPTLNWQISEAPTESAGSDFNYTDNGNGTYTLTNYKDLTGGFLFDFEQSFSFLPSLVKVDTDGRLEKTSSIHLAVDADLDGRNEVETNRSLSLELQNRLNPGTLSLDLSTKDRLGGAHLVWQDSWGPRPADDDGNTYFYVLWHADYMRGAGSTLPFTSTLIEESPVVDTAGTVKGTNYYTWHNNSFYFEVNTAYPKIAQTDGDVSYRQIAAGAREAGVTKYRLPDIKYPSAWDLLSTRRPKLSQFYLKRYPLSLLRGKTKEELATEGVEVSAAVRVEERADTGHVEVLHAEKKVNVTFILAEGDFNKHNFYSGLSSIEGGRTLLLSDDTARIASSWNGRAYSWKTNGLTFVPRDGSVRTGDTWHMAVREGAPYYMSGAGKELAKLSGNELLGDGTARPFAEEDYYYHGFNLSFSEYDRVSTYVGDELGNPIKDKDMVRPFEVWVRTRGNTAFEKYAEVTWNGRGFTFVDVDGNILSGTVNVAIGKMYPLPENTVDIEWRHDSVNFGVDFESTMSVVVRPTDDVKERLTNDKAKGEDSLLAAYAERFVNGRKTDDTKSNPMSITGYNLTDVQSTASVRYAVGALTDDSANAVQSRPVSLGVNNWAFGIVGALTGTGDSYEEDSLWYKKYALREGSFYNLLPPGTYVDPNEKITMNYSWAYMDRKDTILIPEEYYETEIIPDYEQSGQTMVVVKWNVPYEELPAFKLGDPTIWANFTVYNTYDNIIDRGRNTKGTLAFVNQSENVPYNRRSPITPEGLVYGDVYTSLAAENADEIMFTENGLDFDVVTVSQAGYTKQVSTILESSFKDEIKIKGTRDYLYRLRYVNGKDTLADKIIFYDVLEEGAKSRKSQWKGDFVRVDLSALSGKISAGSQNDKLAPVVYYATAVPAEGQLDLTDPIWSTVAPSDSAQVKAVAVDATQTVSGNDFILDKQSSLSVFIRMRAPAELALDEQTTVNSSQVDTRTFIGTRPASTDSVRRLEASAAATLYVETTDLTANKVWAGGGYAQGREVSLQLYAQKGKDTEKTPVGEAVNTVNGTYTWEDLPVRDKDDHKLVYTVEETEVPRLYRVSYTSPDPGVITVTNTWEQQYTDISVQKNWVGPDAGSVEMILVQNGEEQTQRLRLDKANGWKGRFSALPVYDPATGEAYTYTVREVSVPGYETVVTGTAKDGFTVTNTITGKTSVGVTKRWIGEPAKEAVVRLLADGEEIDAVTLTQKTNWQHTFADLEKYRDGKEIAYTVREDAIDGYSSRIEEPQPGSYVVVNTNEAVTGFPVSKKWIGPTGDPVEIILLRDGVEQPDSLTLDEENKWQGSFADLPVFDHETGEMYTYTIREVSVPGYETVVTGTEKDGFTVTNTITGKTSVGVTKRWIGEPAKEAVIRLLADGEEIDAVTLTQKTNWQHTFADLEKYRDGKEIAYTVREDVIDGYSSRIEETQPGSYVVTNTNEAVPPAPKAPKEGAPKTGDMPYLLYGWAMLAILSAAVICKQRPVIHKTGKGQRR